MRKSSDVVNQVRHILDGAVGPRQVLRYRRSERQSEDVRFSLVVAELAAVELILVALSGLTLYTYTHINPHTDGLFALFFGFLIVFALAILAEAARTGRRKKILAMARQNKERHRDSTLLQR